MFFGGNRKTKFPDLRATMLLQAVLPFEGTLRLLSEPLLHCTGKVERAQVQGRLMSSV